MLFKFLFLCLILVDARSVDKVSEKNVAKRAANAEFFPDWVPFKNKHGDELGEFVQIEPKKKPRKRLAQPMSFRLKSLADNDYDDFGGGGGDNGDDYEKKEWSDLYRPGAQVTQTELNHTDLSDIDSVVTIINTPIFDYTPEDTVLTTTAKPETTTMFDDDDYLDHSKESDSHKREDKKVANDNKEIVNDYKESTTNEKEVSNKEVSNDKKEVSNDSKEVSNDSKEFVNDKEISNDYKETTTDEKEVSDDDKYSTKKVEEKDVSENKKTSEEDYNYEDEKKQKEKQAQIEMDRKESARRALILKSVDELKLRHQMLSEKEKEDEIFKEEHERDRLDSEEGRDKYERRKPKFHNFYESYDDNLGSTSYDKYDIKTETTTLKPTTTNIPVRKSKKTKKHKKKINKPKERVFEKISVFKNPEAFIVEEDIEENKAVTSPSTTKPYSPMPKRTTIRPRNRKPGKFSSKYTKIAPPVVKNRENLEESVRISLVPEASDSDESPTLFFPQTKSKRKKKRGKNDTANTYEAESVTGTKGKYSTLTTSDVDIPLDNNTVPDTTGSDTVKIDITSPSGTENGDDVSTFKTNVSNYNTESNVSNYGTAPDVSNYNSADELKYSTVADESNLNTVPDAAAEPDVVAVPNVVTAPDLLSAPDVSVPDVSSPDVTAPDVEAAPSEKKEKDKPSSQSHKKGGGHDYSSSHEEVRGEHGKKAYEGKHEETKQAKGHHDKEDHSGEYVDKAGTDKKHHDESNHYGKHHHEEHGKKHAKYEESGKHSKGHSTKGSHDIHKKEEYEKRVEFFEEDGDSSEEEKHGGYHHSREHATGGNFKKGKLESALSAHDQGHSGHHIRGGNQAGHKGHKLATGHDGHGRHHQAHIEKGGKQQGKRWGYGYSTPGKIANLITIDRRADQFYNGPQYYG